MNTLIQHAQIIIKMKECGLESDFIRKFSLQDIINCCERIEKSDLRNFDYSEFTLIQEELIRDEKIIKPIQLSIIWKNSKNCYQILKIIMKKCLIIVIEI